jgi:alpha-aminoadipic semialdehyde synthase
MIGIRAEHKNEWERRTPLAPDHVHELIDRHSLEIVVQPSRKRIFPEKDFLAAGARINDDLHGCRVVLGVKEIPKEHLQPNITYLFFSHVIKGQAGNMPLLKRLMDLGCTLLDYERITDENGRRLIFFGRHAGYAGMIDTLWALGQRLEHEGIHTPFREIRHSLHYHTLDEAARHIRDVGEKIRHTGLPDELDPVVFAFTGSGNVTEGAREIFSRLPFARVKPADIPALADDPYRPRNILYKVAFPRPDRFTHRDGKLFNPNEFREFPRRYRNALEPLLPHFTVLVHGAYWDPAQPKTLTLQDLKRLWSGDGNSRLRVIGDITCDIGGGIEATVMPASPGDPVYTVDPDDGSPTPGFTGRGPVVLAVDNLPCELPVESSQHFGDSLVRYVPLLAGCDWNLPLSNLGLPPELHRAVVVHRGELTPDYRHLAEAVNRYGEA